MNFSDSFQTLDSLKIGEKQFVFYNISKLHDKYPAIQKLPKSKKILIENLLRLEDGKDVNKSLIEKVLQSPEKNHEIFFLPARVLMQDFTGVPAVADLAAMRDAVALKGKDPAKVCLCSHLSWCRGRRCGDLHLDMLRLRPTICVAALSFPFLCWWFTA